MIFGIFLIKNYQMFLISLFVLVGSRVPQQMGRQLIMMKIFLVSILLLHVNVGVGFN